MNKARTALRISVSQVLTKDKCALCYLRCPPLDSMGFPATLKGPLGTLGTGLRTLIGCPIYSEWRVKLLQKEPLSLQEGSVTTTGCLVTLLRRLSTQTAVCCFIKKTVSPEWYGSVGWASSHKAKGCRFNSWSGHMPGLWVRAPYGACTRSNQLMFLSHVDVSLPLPPSLSFVLKINK